MDKALIKMVSHEYKKDIDAILLILKTHIRRNLIVKRILVQVFLLLRIAREFIFRKSVFVPLGKNDIHQVNLDGYRNIFCGYYDVSPFCPLNSNLLIVHGTNYSEYSSPSINKKINILLYDLKSKKITLLDSTNAWNWQQGSRSQWLDAEWVAYNIIVDGLVRAKLKNIITGEERILPINLSIAHKDEYIISLDYMALSKGSEYGYPGLKGASEDRFIKMYDIRTHDVKKLFNWNILLSIAPQKSSRHHINHILPSPDGSNFVFIFRYWIGKIRYDSLVHYDFATQNISVIIKNETVSHYTWQNQNILLAWLIIKGVPGYYFVDINKKTFSIFSSITDGHPTFINSTSFITEITDRRLFSIEKIKVVILKTNTDKIHELLLISHPAIFNPENRCDAHISLSRDKKRFQMDSRHMYGQRRIIVCNLKKY